MIVTDNYKCIALDIDGTLLNSKMELDVSVADSLKFLINKGYICVLISGRTLPDMMQIFSGIPVHYFAALNGAVIYNNQSREIEFIKPVKQAVFDRIVKLIGDIPTMVYTPSVVYYTAYAKEYYSRVYQKSLSPIHMSKYSADDEPLSIQLICDNEIITSRIFETLTKKFSSDCSIENAGYNFIQITAKDVDKGKALHYLAKQCGVDMSQTIAVGDSPADLPMLQEAGLGVAMKNGVSDLFDRVDAVTECDNNENGALNFILKRLNLLEK